MKYRNTLYLLLISLLSLFITSVQASGLGESLSLDKKPHVISPQYHYENIHQFENTPFKNWDEFVQTVIQESSDITFDQINKINKEIRPILHNLINENFFKIFRLNLYKECPFWSGSEGFCMHRSCAVDTIDDWKDLPDIWQPEALGKIEGYSKESPVPLSPNGSCIAEGKDNSKDYCEIDENNNDVVYVNLVENPERFTGYGGDQSFQIWKSIYSENCFNLGHDQCIEKNFFYKLVSGMHSSISTHLTNEFLDFNTKQYGPNLKQFMIRVGDFPDRFENLYLNYIIVAKALIKLENLGILDKLNFCDDSQFQSKEAELKGGLKQLVAPFSKLGDNTESCLFNEDLLFQGDDAELVKDEFREKFRNVSTIMDCVHCDRCRLWGKVQTTGYGTALKVLFELKDSEDLATLDVSKMEIIALLNTFDRVSKTVNSIGNFKNLFDKAMEDEENGTTEDPTLGSESDSLFFQDISTEPKKSARVKEADKLQSPAKKKQQQYDDIIFPESGEEWFGPDGFWGDVKQEIEVVGMTLKMIWRSYFILPKIIYNWLLIRATFYWNIFVGRVVEDFDVDRLYREF